MGLHFLWIGLGGALGAMIRAFIGSLLPGQIAGIPIPILAINIIGCWIMGMLAESMALYWSPPDYLRYFLMTGVLGGFTTFSAFALDTVLLSDRSEFGLAILYIVLSVGLSLTGFILGMKLIRLI